jgi:alcohol dehydrogenase YqhD (iron-dependent ADH family)
MALSGVSVAYYRYIMKYAVKRFARFATAVWGINPEGKTEGQLANEGVDSLAAWIKEIGAANEISSLGVTEDMLDGIANATIIRDGGYKKLSHDEVVEILRKSM